MTSYTKEQVVFGDGMYVSENCYVYPAYGFSSTSNFYYESRKEDEKDKAFAMYLRAIWACHDELKIRNGFTDEEVYIEEGRYRSEIFKLNRLSKHEEGKSTYEKMTEDEKESFRMDVLNEYNEWWSENRVRKYSFLKRGLYYMNPLARIMLGCPPGTSVDIMRMFNKSKELEKICRPRDIRVVADCRSQSDVEPNEKEQEKGIRRYGNCARCFGIGLRGTQCMRMHGRETKCSTLHLSRICIFTNKKGFVINPWIIHYVLSKYDKKKNDEISWLNEQVQVESVREYKPLPLNIHEYVLPYACHYKLLWIANMYNPETYDYEREIEWETLGVIDVMDEVIFAHNCLKEMLQEFIILWRRFYKGNTGFRFFHKDLSRNFLFGYQLQQEQQNMSLNDLISLNAECRHIINKDNEANKKKRKQETKKAKKMKAKKQQQEHNRKNVNEVPSEMIDNDVSENSQIDEEQKRGLKRSRP